MFDSLYTMKTLCTTDCVDQGVACHRDGKGSKVIAFKLTMVDVSGVNVRHQYVNF